MKTILKSPNTVCPPDNPGLRGDHLFEIIENLLAPADRSKVDQHLAVCRVCADELFDARAYLELPLSEQDKAAVASTLQTPESMGRRMVRLYEKHNPDSRAVDDPEEEHVPARWWERLPAMLQAPKLAGAMVVLVLVVGGYSIFDYSQTGMVIASVRGELIEAYQMSPAAGRLSGGYQSDAFGEMSDDDTKVKSGEHALKMLRGVLKYDPNNLEAKQQILHVLVHRDDLAAAEAFVDSLPNISELFPKFQMDIAVLRIRQQRWREAEALLQPLLSSEYGPEVYQNYAVAQIGLNNISEARAALAKAEMLEKDNAWRALIRRQLTDLGKGE